jgi:Anti-sigma factor NepR
VAEKQKSGRKDPHGEKDTERKGTGGFDSWLENKLRSAYSSVLDEPIPDDLVQLIAQKLKD